MKNKEPKKSEKSVLLKYILDAFGWFCVKNSPMFIRTDIVSPNILPLRTKLFNLAAACVVVLFVCYLLDLGILHKIVEFSRLSVAYDRSKIEIPVKFERPLPPPQKIMAQKSSASPVATPMPLSAAKSAPISSHIAADVASAPVSIAVAGVASGKNIILPRLNNPTQRTAHDLECQQIDQKDRPRDCPKTDLARKIIQAVQAPHYRPDNVQGITRAEMASKRSAGWTEGCENDDGSKPSFCIPFGKKSRVRTPYELCMEKGLGGCTRPPMPDGTPSQSLNYGN